MAWLLKVQYMSEPGRGGNRQGYEGYLVIDYAMGFHTTDNPLTATRYEEKAAAEDAAVRLVAIHPERLLGHLKLEWRLGRWPPEG